MGFVGSMLSSGNGAGFKAGGAPLEEGVNVGQAQTAYNQTQTGLEQQQAFLQALQAQGGIQNQANVFNQLQGVANGTGPNPALAQLNQATGQNVANQAALMAGQRGTNANAGLLARQAAQQGGAIQQNAAGQGASMMAGQQLNALNQLGGIAGQQVGQQAQALSGYNAAAQGQQGNILSGLAALNNSRVGMQSNVNTSNAGIAGQNAAAQGQMLGGLMGGAGSAMGLAHGGMVPDAQCYADGGVVDPSGPQSAFGRFSQGFQKSYQPATGTAQAPMFGAGQMIGKGIGKGLSALFSHSTPATMAGGPMDTMGMPQPIGGDTMYAAQGGPVDGKVPGKPAVKGDSLKNDKVKAMLSPGEIVIPRSIATGPDAPKRAAEFVAKVLGSQGLKRKK